jgi:hypothetical protein
MSAFGGKADMEWKVFTSVFDPKRTRDRAPRMSLLNPGGQNLVVNFPLFWLPETA